MVNVTRELRSALGNFEVIVVNDGSTKGISVADVAKLQSEGIIWHEYQLNQGKGFALRAGVQLAGADFIIYTDIDYPYCNQSFIDIYNQLREGNNVVIGIRGAAYYSHLTRTRAYISKLLRWLIKTFLQIPTDDTQCGLKGFSKEAKATFLATSINRYLFDMEFIFLATKQKLQIATVEVTLRPEIMLSKMNWVILMQESVNFVKIFLRQLFSK